MDVETSANITKNFLHYQAKYLSKKLDELGQILPELNPKERGLLPELLAHLVYLLPLEGRPELLRLKQRINFEHSDVLRSFVEEQRRKLGLMMGQNIVTYENPKDVDDNTGVDMQFALGWKKCVQADFLIPALMAMAKEINLPITIIPEGGLVNVPVIFGSRMTSTFLRHLQYFAQIYGIDQKIAEQIEEQFFKHMENIKEKSVEFDLKCVDFLAKVIRSEFLIFHEYIL
jgi:hypothetical protein